EVELLGERREVARRDSAHGLHELLEPRRVAVELLEHRRARALEFVLRLARLEAFAEITPEGIEPGVRHLEETAHVAGAAPVEEGGAFRGVSVACRWPVAVPLEEAERHQRVREIRHGAGMEAEKSAKLLGRPGRSAERGED